MKTNKYIVAFLAFAIAATFIFVAITFMKSDKTIEQAAINAKNTSIEKTQESSVDQAQTEPLNPLPADEKKAVDTEIDAIDKELDSLANESLNDLSGIENEL